MKRDGALLTFGFGEECSISSCLCADSDRKAVEVNDLHVDALFTCFIFICLPLPSLSV
jgi:hypothetical protein